MIAHDAKPVEGQPDPFSHGPRPATRISADSISPAELASMMAAGELVQVNEDWKSNPPSLPARAMFVMYPNGDLEHL